MLPYVEHPSISLGPVTIQAFEVLVCLAVLAGYQIMVVRAERFGLDRPAVSVVAAWMIALGFVGSHVFDVLAYRPERLLESPFELVRIPGSMSSFGGIFAGLAAAWVVMRRRGFSRDAQLRYFDLVGFAFPFAWLLGRLGCALAHDHPGVRSEHWLAVRFPDGARFDLGLLEALVTLPIALGFLLLARRPRPAGCFLGLFFAVYGPARFALDTLRTGDARYLGWTPGQYASVLATLLGAALLIGAARRACGLFPTGRAPGS